MLRRFIGDGLEAARKAPCEAGRTKLKPQKGGKNMAGRIATILLVTLAITVQGCRGARGLHTGEGEGGCRTR